MRQMPPTNSTTASASMTLRRRRLEEMIQSNMATPQQKETHLA
jgi:hypothetical protein